MVKRTIVLLSIIFLATGLGWAASSDGYNFISAEELKKRINGQSSIFTSPAALRKNGC